MTEESKQKKGYRGYISSRPANGIFVPQRIQNLVIRNYAQARGLIFLLSATEYYMENCFMMLEAVMKEELSSLEGIILFSLDLMPADRMKREYFYTDILQNEASLHFALEGLKLSNAEECSAIEDIFIARVLSEQPRSLKHSEKDVFTSYNERILDRYA